MSNGGILMLRLRKPILTAGLLVAFFAAMAGIACGGDDDNTQATQPAAGSPSAAASASSAASLPLASEKIVFGAPVSLTGSTAKEGEQTKNGYQMWVDA